MYQPNILLNELQTCEVLTAALAEALAAYRSGQARDFNKCLEFIERTLEERRKEVNDPMNQLEMRAALEWRRASERETDFANLSAPSIYQQASPEDEMERSRRTRCEPFVVRKELEPRS